MGSRDKRILTERQAYRAMLVFLERHYDRTRSEEIAVLLGSASLLDDGYPADPAIREEWHDCVTAILSGDAGTLAAE